MLQVYRITVGPSWFYEGDVQVFHLDVQKADAVFGPNRWVENPHVHDPNVHGAPGRTLKGKIYLLVLSDPADLMFNMMAHEFEAPRAMTAGRLDIWRRMMERFDPATGIGKFPWEP